MPFDLVPRTHQTRVGEGSSNKLVERFKNGSMYLLSQCNFNDPVQGAGNGKPAFTGVGMNGVRSGKTEYEP